MSIGLRIILNSVPNLDSTLEQEQETINSLVTNKRNDLKNLWAGYLMERGPVQKGGLYANERKGLPQPSSRYRIAPHGQRTPEDRAGGNGKKIHERTELHAQKRRLRNKFLN